MDLSKQIFQLAIVMKTTNEYKNLVKAMEILHSKPELESKLHTLKQKEKSAYQTSNPESAMQLLEQEYRQLENYPEIKNYFQAAGQFNQLLEQVHENLIQHLQIS